MAIQGLSTNYSGRKVDLHIFQGVSAPNPSNITPSFGKISNFCSGIQKLVQRYAINLLTEIGSQPDFLTFGTDLIPTLSSKSLRYNKADLYNIFNLASVKVLREFLAYQSTTTVPDDEALNNAVLNDIVSSPGGISIRVTIVSLAQDQVQFLLPLPI